MISNEPVNAGPHEWARTPFSWVILHPIPYKLREASLHSKFRKRRHDACSRTVTENYEDFISKAIKILVSTEINPTFVRRCTTVWSDRYESSRSLDIAVNGVPQNSKYCAHVGQSNISRKPFDQQLFGNRKSS